MSNFFQSTNINAGKYYQNGIEIDLGGQGAQGAQGAQGIHGAAGNQGAQGTQGAQGATSGGVFPPGSIIMWNGTGNPQPLGWYLCDGSTYTGTTGTTLQTPDLRDRFVIGAGVNAVDASGGSEFIRVNNLPPHKHGIYENTGESGTDGVVNVLGGGDPSLFQTTNQVNSNGTPVPDTDPAPYYPPYYALYYIMYIP